MMMTEDLPDDLKGYIRNSEIKITQLEKYLEKENEKPEKGTCAAARFRTGSCRVR